MRLCAEKRKSAFDPRWERRAANWCKWFCARAWFRFWRGWGWERSVPRFPAICWLRCCSKCAPPTRASSRRRESRWWRSAFWPTICRPVAQDAWTQLRPCEPNNDVTHVLMSEPTSYPYETRLNIHRQQGEVIDERALADACAYKWYNQPRFVALCKKPRVIDNRRVPPTI